MRMKASDYRILRMKYVWFFVFYSVFPFFGFQSAFSKFVDSFALDIQMCAFHCIQSEFQKIKI